MNGTADDRGSGYGKNKMKNITKKRITEDDLKNYIAGLFEGDGHV